MNTGNMTEESRIKNEEAVYWPSQEEYPLSITKDQWKKYINEVEHNHEGCMGMLKALMELGGEAS